MNSPRLTNILLIIIGILLAVAIFIFYQTWEDTHLKVYETTNPSVQQDSEQFNSVSRNDLEKPVYTNDKFGVTFSYDSSHLLRDPNRANDSSDFSIDAVGNGRTYKCRLDNGSMRLYSEKEVSETNVDVTNCSYEAPNLEVVAQGQFSASWSKELYGVGKNIKDLTVAGRPAKLVYGSTKTRTLIIFLALPYTENGYKYDFLSLQADESLMNDIISTFKFTK